MRSRRAAQRAALHRDQEIGERDELAERHMMLAISTISASGQEPEVVEEHDAAHDGVGSAEPSVVRGEHRQHVGGDVADRRRDDQRPGVLDGVVAAPRELPAAARAVARLAGLGRPREQARRFRRKRDRPGRR